MNTVVAPLVLVPASDVPPTMWFVICAPVLWLLVVTGPLLMIEACRAQLRRRARAQVRAAHVADRNAVFAAPQRPGLPIAAPEPERVA